MPKLNSDLWSSPNARQLIRAFQECKSGKELQNFLRDLLTEEEIFEFSLRLETARLLSEGTPYSQIQATTGFSSTTVARVSKWIKQGAGGYKIVLERLRVTRKHNHN